MGEVKTNIHPGPVPMEIQFEIGERPILKMGDNGQPTPGIEKFLCLSIVSQQGINFVFLPTDAVEWLIDQLKEHHQAMKTGIVVIEKRLQVPEGVDHPSIPQGAQEQEAEVVQLPQPDEDQPDAEG